VKDPVTVWRLCARQKAEAAFTGNGAYRRGGRWNLPRTRVVYCAESRALAAMEILVHVEDMEDLAQLEWRAMAVTLPWEAIERPDRFPSSWGKYPYSPATQKFGSAWAHAGRTVALQVPSAVVPGEFNFLLNPEHEMFARLKIAPAEPFRFDSRIGR
jgi:RES domain-containing protein